jgi:hypothetical protein
MLFPNFYVPSVPERFVAVFKRSRMSLSHPGGREQNFNKIRSRLMPEGYAQDVEPVPRRGLPTQEAPQNGFSRAATVQLSWVLNV